MSREAKPRHEVVHEVAAFFPLWIVLEKLHVEPVQAARRADVE